MLRITVEILPYGEASMARKIGEGYIYNDGTEGGPDYGNYICNFSDEYGDTVHDSVVKKFCRGRGVWGLLREALRGHCDVG